MIKKVLIYKYKKKNKKRLNGPKEAFGPKIKTNRFEKERGGAHAEGGVLGLRVHFVGDRPKHVHIVFRVSLCFVQNRVCALQTAPLPIFFISSSLSNMSF